jgi:hypothetical protein
MAVTAAKTPATIGREVARSVRRQVRSDPRIAWELGGSQVKINSTIALTGASGLGGREAKRRAFYAALEAALYGTGWERSGNARYRYGG